MKLTPFTISLAATVAVYLVSGFAISQPVGIGTNIPSANAALEITATDKGMFVPRLTTLERNAISTSANEAGLLVFDVDQKLFYYWNSTTWIPFPDIVDTDNQVFSLSNDTIFIQNGNWAVLSKDGDWAYSGNDLHNLNAEGVAIGSTTPSAKLSVKAGVTGTMSSVLNIENSVQQPLFFGKLDGKWGINNGNPGVEVDVIGDQKVWQIVPRYYGPDSFTVPTTDNVATFEEAIYWERNQHLYVRYVFFDNGINWWEANEAARYLGGYLVTATSEAENQFIIDNLLDSAGAYVGITDSRIEGKWQWLTGEIGVDGQNSIFTYWRPGEPNNDITCGGEDGAVYTPAVWDSTHRWNDLSIDTAFTPYCDSLLLPNNVDAFPNDDLIIEFEYIKSP